LFSHRLILAQEAGNLEAWAPDPKTELSIASSKTWKKNLTQRRKGAKVIAEKGTRRTDEPIADERGWYADKANKSQHRRKGTHDRCPTVHFDLIRSPHLRKSVSICG
jgi:hypothetical protein